ncbi:MAG: 4-hydroxy-3-methylbut-2-enyl diphosphate reductase [Bacteroidota bacterium]
MSLEVTIDNHSGFCFGVVYAIEMAEDELSKTQNLYCLGDIVHNSMEVDRLAKLGLQVIDNEQLKGLENCKVLIRAHGEPPETYKIALENNIELIDASCPVVLKLQNRIRLGFEECVKNNGQIVIYGKKGHAEVNGLEGQTKGKAVIINSFEDIEKIDFSKPVYLFSQTTQSTELYAELVKIIKEKLDLNNQALFNSNDTICRQVSNRAPLLKEFAKKFDVIVFVSGKKSSNGLYLYEICKQENPKSYMVENSMELKPEWVENIKTVGIAGATSTPMWLMQEVADGISNA